MTARRYCFTLFEYEVPAEVFKAPLDRTVRYVVWQEEECPDTHRRHIQGYLRFANAQRMAAVKRIIGKDSVHVSRCNGSEAQNVKYCTKEESRVSGPWEIGTPLQDNEGNANGQGNFILFFIF